LLDGSGEKLEDEPGVEAWVKEHWDEVKGLERLRTKITKETRNAKKVEQG
jgi:hypothetical protein